MRLDVVRTWMIVATVLLPAVAHAQGDTPASEPEPPAPSVALPLPVAPPLAVAPPLPPAPPRPSTGLKIAHGANIAFPAMLFGLSFFSTYAGSRGTGDLPAREWVQYYQGLSSQPVPTIPILQLGSIISGTTVLVMTRNFKRPSFIAAGVGLLAAVAGTIVTLALTAPKVGAVDEWNPNNPPADWAEYRSALRDADTLRAVLHGAAVLANVTSLALEW